ncbi:hypothetical protein KKH43_02240 [Patescibacteria group bacterium]|nr:hypothetical protein [Patescibacteria group bacterium]
MGKEKTLQDVYKAVEELKSTTATKKTAATKKELNEAVEDLKKTMLTKKEYLKREEKLATKKDLEKFATKEDMKKFATKKDLKKVKQEVSDLRETFEFFTQTAVTKDEMSKMQNEIVNHIDDFLHLYKKTDEEQIALVARTDSHENRITKLEKVK